MKEQIITFKKGLKSWHKGMAYTPRNFKPHEVDCHCRLSDCKTTKMSTLTAQRLDDSRELTGRSHTVTSWYRCPKHNKAVGGVSNSQHLTGKAVDLKVSGMPPRCVQTMMRDRWFKNGGVGHYNTFTHVDTANKRTWGTVKPCKDYADYFLKKPLPPEKKTPEELRIIELEERVKKYTSLYEQSQKDLASCKTEKSKLEKINQDLLNANTSLKVQVTDLQKEVKQLELHPKATDVMKENNGILKWIKGLLTKIFK